MQATLYVIPGSHPCAAAERALELKGIAYERVDLLPLAHKVIQHRRFGGSTVPGAVLGGERVLGSTAILRRLDELVPDPPLRPADPDARREVDQAERWGDEVLQPIVRRLSWALLQRAPGAMITYAEGAKLPIPARVATLGSGLTARISGKFNGASDPAVRADLANLPHHLDRVDRWIEDGVLGGPRPNAADLQIGASLRLAITFGDLAPIVDARPGGRLAREQFPGFPGNVPAGTLPSAWLPAAAGA